MDNTTGRPLVPDDIVNLSTALAGALRARGWSCATAESCTGGGIALGITSVAGSSDYMVGGVIAYSNRVKRGLLGVRDETLASVGAVSPECAREMARGVRRALRANVGIASTGIAGPGGATTHKPVGLVYIATATPEAEDVQELRLSGNRLQIMRESARLALELTLTSVGAEAPETEHQRP